MKKIILVIAVALLAVFAFFFSNKTKVQNLSELSPTTAVQVSTHEPNYTDPDFGYRLYIPEGMTVEKQNKYSTLFYPEKQPLGAGPTNFIYVSVVPPDIRRNTGEIYNYNPDHFEKLISLEKVGDSVNVTGGDVPNMGEWFTYTVVGKIDFGTGSIKNFENTKPWEFPAGTTENRFIYGTADNIYILGYYTGGNSGATIDPREAYQSILSFKRE